LHFDFYFHRKLASSMTVTIVGRFGRAPFTLKPLLRRVLHEAAKIKIHSSLTQLQKLSQLAYPALQRNSFGDTCIIDRHGIISKVARGLS